MTGITQRCVYRVLPTTRVTDNTCIINETPVVIPVLRGDFGGTITTPAAPKPQWTPGGRPPSNKGARHGRRDY